MVTASSQSPAKSTQAGPARKAGSRKGAGDTQLASQNTPAGTEAAQRTTAPVNFTPTAAAPAGQTEAGSQSTAAAATTGAPREAGARGQTISYRVKDGDTLFSIAKRFNTSVDDIKVLNALTSNIVKVGQLIHVPGAGL